MKAMAKLKENGIESAVMDDKATALQMIKSMIPAGASVMSGSSRTLEEIGFIDYFKTNPLGWDNLKEKILQEKDPARQSVLRKQSVISDFYLGSVHALTEEGEILIASNSGSQLPHLAFTSPNVILIVGAQKIVPDLKAALSRLEKYVFPLEDKRMKDLDFGGSQISKILTIKKENKIMDRKVSVIFVREKLGF